MRSGFTPLLALGIVGCLAGCTALLGDFSQGDGGGPDATTEGGDDASSQTDGRGGTGIRRETPTATPVTPAAPARRERPATRAPARTASSPATAPESPSAS